MKQFIISEQEKSRILEMHQNATSRQFLMEDDKGHDGQVIEIFLPWKKNEKGEIIPAREAFMKQGYTPSFRYYPGQVEGTAIKNNGNKPVSSLSKIEDSTGNTVITPYNAQTYDATTNSIFGTVSPSQAGKYSWDATKTSNYSVVFKDGGVINPIAVKYKQGTEYKPTQN